MRKGNYRTVLDSSQKYSRSIVESLRKLPARANSRLAFPGNESAVADVIVSRMLLRAWSEAWKIAFSPRSPSRRPFFAGPRAVHPPPSLFSPVAKFYQRDIFRARYILTGYRRILRFVMASSSSPSRSSFPFPLCNPYRFALFPHFPHKENRTNEREKGGRAAGGEERERKYRISARRAPFDKSFRYGHKVSPVCVDSRWTPL